MRTKLWLACAAVAAISTSASGAVVVVRSLGPSAKAYPPGKTLPETAKIALQGGDVVTVIGPGSAKTLRGPGNFDAKQMCWPRPRGSAADSARSAPAKSRTAPASGTWT